MSHGKVIDEIFDELVDELFSNAEDNEFYGKFVDSYKIPPAISTDYYSSRNFKVNLKEVIGDANGQRNIRTKS